MIRHRQPGAPVTITVERGKVTRTFRLATKDIGNQPVIGVQLNTTFTFPFTVKIYIPDIGGPSAGMMFALGIIDKLTADNLTAGKFIAGTGEIDATGGVQPIGGIQQKKMAGARDSRRDCLPRSGRQLQRHRGLRARRAAGRAGQHACRRRAGAAEHQAGPAGSVVLTWAHAGCLPDRCGP